MKWVKYRRKYKNTVSDITIVKPEVYSIAWGVKPIMWYFTFNKSDDIKQRLIKQIYTKQWQKGKVRPRSIPNMFAGINR